MAEEALSGGHVNGVVRIGDTVRRSAGGWTPTIHRLLAHARSRGLLWVPEPRGTDELGREVLSFIPGEVPHEEPEWLWSVDVLTDAARSLRQWHDVTSTFDVAGAIWRLAPRQPGEVVCHNDFAPYNCVFRSGRLVGAIDFDCCSPGPRLWDVAYCAYRFVPLMPPEIETPRFGPAEMVQRLALFSSAYGAGSASLVYGRGAVLGAVVERLLALATWTEGHALESGKTGLERDARMYRTHAAWLREQPLRGG